MAQSVPAPVRSGMAEGDANLSARLQRLEEAQAFSDHAAAQLSDEVRALSRHTAAIIQPRFLAQSVPAPVRSGMAEGDANLSARLQRLEEAQAFADHAAAQLSDEVRALS